MITRLVYRYPRTLMILVITLAIIAATLIRRFHVGIYHSVAAHAHCRVLFIGDSLTAQAGVWGWRLGRWWPDHQNHARSGADLYLIGTIVGEVLPDLQPDCVVLMAGINDLGRGHDVQQVLSEYEQVLARIRATPSVKHVIVLSTLYRRDAQYVAEINAINKALRDRCDREGMRFLDLRPKLCANERLRPEVARDVVHLNSEGYRLWAEELEPVLFEILK